MLRKGDDVNFPESDSSDPTSGLTNMVDIMLVLAVGFLILAITSTGMDITNSSTTHVQSDQHQETFNVTQGQEIDDNIMKSDSSGSGYSKVGSVYEDSETGKLVMVQS